MGCPWVVILLFLTMMMRFLDPILALKHRTKSRSVHFERSRCLATVESSFEGYQQPDTKHNAYEQALQSGNKFPCIILVNPYSDQNVGSVARTMMNFGMTELRVVNPNCDIHSEKAKALSAGAFEILEHAKVYSDLQHCIADLTHVFATTNRPRHMTQMVYTPSKAAEISLNATYSDERTGIMFGRERYGLYNREMAMATGMISIPTFSHFSSLNLAQSVNIIAYELWNRNDFLHATAPPGQWLQPKDKDRLARREYLDHYFLRLEKALDERNFTLDEQRRIYVYQSVRNIFQRIMMSGTEVDLMHGVLTALTRPPRKRDSSMTTTDNPTSGPNVEDNDK